MTAFEDFVNLELPKRGAVLLSTELGYVGDPNLAVDPGLNNAPEGRTYYWDSTNKLLWHKRGSTSTDWTQVHEGVPPTAPSLTIVTTQAELDAALDRFPDEFIGHHEIEIRTSGLKLSRAKMPIPAFGSSAGLDIIADRSTVTVTNSSYTFLKDGSTAVQWEEAAFGAHAGITAGDFWVEEDVSALSPGLTTYHYEALPTSSPAVRVMGNFAPFGGTINVHPRTITLDVTGDSTAVNPVFYGGQHCNLWGSGVRFIGFRIDAASAVSKLVGFSFIACDFRGFGRYENCLLNGHIGPTGSNQIVLTNTDDASGSPARIDGLHATGGSISLHGRHKLGNLVSSIGISVRTAAHISSAADADFRLTSGTCFTYADGATINLGNAQMTLGLLADRFIAPVSNLAYLPGAQIFFDNTGVITGTVAVNGIVVQNGGSCTNAAAVCDGTLIVTGSEILLDGVAHSFIDDAFSLDTGGFLKA